MKKHIIIGIAIIACVALCAAVWPSIAEVEDLPAEFVKTTVIAEIRVRSEETSPIFLSTEIYASKSKTIAESEPTETNLTAEETTQKPAHTPIQAVQPAKQSSISVEPSAGDVRVVDGVKQLYIEGFGWIKDEGGGAQGSMVGNPGDELTGNKIAQMGGSVTVHGKGDINKQVGVMGSGDAPPSNIDPAPGTKKNIDGMLHVWVPDFEWIEYSGKPSVGIVAKDMYESGQKIGSMGGGETPPKKTTPLATEQAEPIDGEIHIVFVDVPEKNTTPPPYKPETVSP